MQCVRMLVGNLVLQSTLASASSSDAPNKPARPAGPARYAWRARCMSLGPHAFSVVVTHGLVEYLAPVRCYHRWTIYPRAAVLAALSVAVRASVAARTREDILWDFLLEDRYPEEDYSSSAGDTDVGAASPCAHD